jgi:hypothetical protein
VTAGAAAGTAGAVGRAGWAAAAGRAKPISGKSDKRSIKNEIFLFTTVLMGE